VNSKIRKADVRFIAATNRNLEKESEAEHFRSDLFYRVSVFQLTLSPLRERTEDIEPLAEQFLERAAAKNNKRILSMEPDFLLALKEHYWKGNIRELKNVIERCVIIADKEALHASLLPFDFNVEGNTHNQALDLASVEKNHIQKMLAYTHGNKTHAAKVLGIGLTTLYQKIKDYNL